jgi:hypothetical protein
VGTLAASAFGRLFLDRTSAGPAFLNWATQLGTSSFPLPAGAAPAGIVIS